MDRTEKLEYEKGIEQYFDEKKSVRSFRKIIQGINNKSS